MRREHKEKQQQNKETEKRKKQNEGERQRRKQLINKYKRWQTLKIEEGKDE